LKFSLVFIVLFVFCLLINNVENSFRHKGRRLNVISFKKYIYIYIFNAEFIPYSLGSRHRFDGPKEETIVGKKNKNLRNSLIKYH